MNPAGVKNLGLLSETLHFIQSDSSSPLGLTDNAVKRFPYLRFSAFRIRLADGFRWLSLPGTLSHDSLFCQRAYRLLVLVNAFDYSMGGIGLEPTTFAMSTQRSNQLS